MKNLIRYILYLIRFTQRVLQMKGQQLLCQAEEVKWSRGFQLALGDGDVPEKPLVFCAPNRAVLKDCGEGLLIELRQFVEVR